MHNRRASFRYIKIFNRYVIGFTQYHSSPLAVFLELGEIIYSEAFMHKARLVQVQTVGERPLFELDYALLFICARIY